MSTVLEPHPWNTGFTWPEHAGPFRVSPPSRRGLRRTRLLRARGRLRRRRRSPRSTTRSRRATARCSTSSRTQPDGRFSVAGTDTVRRAAPRAPLRLSRDFCASPVLRRPVPRPDRPRRAAVLGSVRLQEAASGRAGPVAPGQRLHVRRAAGVPHVLDRVHRRDARERLRVGHARRAPPRHAAHREHADRLPVLRRPASTRCRAGARRQHRRVLVADSASHRSNITTRCARRTSCSTHPTARSRSAATPPRPTDRVAQDDAGANSRCSSGAHPSPPPDRSETFKTPARRSFTLVV